MINENDIIDLTSLGGNVGMDKVRPFIDIALRTDVKRILGKKLYDKISIDFKNNSLTGKYKIIYDEYVRYMVAYFTMSHFAGLHPFVIDNGGIFRHSPDQAETADLDDVTTIVNRYKSLGWGIEQEYLEYMKENKIPEVKDSGCCKHGRPIRANFKIQ